MPLGNEAQDRVIVRSYPKIVFLYPTLVAAIIAGVWSYLSLKAAQSGLDPIAALAAEAQVSLAPGRLFCVGFALHLTVLAFDFSRKGFLAVVLTGLLLVTALLLVETRLPVFGWIETFFEVFKLRAHPQFYLAMGFVYLVLIGSVIALAQLDFWEVRSNEILHYQGFMAAVERYPAAGLRFRKVIPDVFEYALLRAGTIVLMPAQGEKHEILNVPAVTSIERRLDGLLGTISVQIQQQAPPPLPPAVPGVG